MIFQYFAVYGQFTFPKPYFLTTFHPGSIWSVDPYPLPTRRSSWPRLVDEHPRNQILPTGLVVKSDLERELSVSYHQKFGCGNQLTTAQAQ